MSTRGRRSLPTVSNVIGPVLCLGSWPLPFQAAPHPTTRTGCIASALAPYRTFALAVARHDVYPFAELSAPVVAWAATGADKSAWRDQRVP